MNIDVANGEIADKLSILEIELKEIKDESKLKNIRNEHSVLNEALLSFMDKEHAFYKELLDVNRQLWRIEDDIRDCERRKDFGPKFVELARSVYISNDKRARIKRKINELTGSRLMEEKSYKAY